MRTFFFSLALLWSFASCTKSPPSVPATISISVTEKGFEPSRISLKKGVPVKLMVTRTTEATCATELLIEGTDINTALPMNKPTAIDFTPSKSGEIKYGCAMGMMVSGVLMVE